MRMCLETKPNYVQMPKMVAHRNNNSDNDIKNNPKMPINSLGFCELVVDRLTEIFRHFALDMGENEVIN